MPIQIMSTYVKADGIYYHSTAVLLSCGGLLCQLLAKKPPHNVYEALSFLQKTTKFYPCTHMVSQTTVSPNSLITIALKWITKCCKFFPQKKHLLINSIEQILVPTLQYGFQPRELCPVPV